MESSNGHSATGPAQPSPTKKPATKATAPAKKTAKSRGTTVKKASAPRKSRAKKTAETTSGSTVTDEQIRTRAYFISEWRAKNGVAGDSAHDWLEARRQLLAEAELA
jgi:hypothetical protein